MCFPVSLTSLEAKRGPRMGTSRGRGDTSVEREVMSGDREGRWAGVIGVQNL